MDKKRWAEIDRIFKDCRTLPVSERDAFLNRECSDKEIRAEVASLLDHHSEQFLETPLVKSTRTERFRRALEALDDDFEVDEPLFESRTSTIFRARETRSGRPVLLKQGRVRNLDTNGILDRQPHGQVKLLRIGSYQNWPALIMEESAGRPLLEVVCERKARIQERVELFLKLCNFVQKAHDAGQIHGRIESSHVLARISADQAPEIELLNTGMVTGLRQSLRSIYLELRGKIGNASALAPEQVELDEPTPRTDVYGLGALLYLLLSEKSAVELPVGETCSANSNAEAICEVIPPLASSVVEPTRRAEVERYDEVLLKALSKSPRSRYASVSILSDAIRACSS